jgi:3'(2'), 5'-bisphosphate nucleotidase
MHEELELAKALALKAGKIAMHYYEHGFEVRYKDVNETDPVTEADKHASELIVDAIAEAFPEDAILSEELPSTHARLNHARLWCIDPIDGTRDFVEHNGQFVVMIGLAVEGYAELGVVYQPTEDMLYWGGKDIGAFVSRAGSQPQRLQTSSTDELRSAGLLLSRTHRSHTAERIAATMGITQREKVGSIGLKVGYIVEGRADLYVSISQGMHEWDTCAPEAILTAAGGLMTDICGRRLVYNKLVTTTPFGVVASNGPLHAKCLPYLRPVAQERGWI